MEGLAGAPSARGLLLVLFSRVSPEGAQDQAWGGSGSVLVSSSGGRESFQLLPSLTSPVPSLDVPSCNSWPLEGFSLLLSMRYHVFFLLLRSVFCYLCFSDDVCLVLEVSGLISGFPHPAVKFSPVFDSVSIHSSVFFFKRIESLSQ